MACSTKTNILRRTLLYMSPPPPPEKDTNATPRERFLRTCDVDDKSVKRTKKKKGPCGSCGVLDGVQAKQLAQEVQLPLQLVVVAALHFALKVRHKGGERCLVSLVDLERAARR